MERRVEGAQAACCIARNYVGVAEADDVFAVQRDKPTQGTRKSDIAGVPAHRLGELECRDDSRQRFGEDFAGRTPSFAHRRDDITAFTAQIGYANAFAARETLSGFGRLAAGIISA